MDAKKNMDQAFIKKVTDIIDVNLENEQFGVRELYRELGISQSNLLRKLKAIKNKSATQFIREYRLQKAMLMLQNNVATSSEIAYRVGFGSPSYFNKCFHKYYGYPPGEAKFRNIKTSDQENISPKTIKTDLSTKKHSSTRRVLFSILGIVCLLAISYLIYYYSKGYLTTKKTEVIIKDKSIAVLPCVNLSNDKENQYFADGQMEAILNHLTKITELRVVSRTTMLKYRETEKSIPEIAKELGVAYVLELSAQKSGQKVNITAQLIDADSDRHLWSDNYVRDLTDVFAIQTEIAKNIASALKASISPSELQQLDKKPTGNFESYELYLKGRFFWHLRTKKDLEKSIYYYNQALELDSTYAIAYAGLADAYFIMAWWGWYPKKVGYMKGQEFALKALSINNKISEAHATLGAIACWQKWNWEDAEKEFKFAISLDPNNATAHQYYAELLDILGKHQKAREEIEIALKLDPHSIIMHNLSSAFYYRNGDYEKALTVNKKVKELSKYFEGNTWTDFNIYVQQDEDLKAIEELEKIKQLNPLTEESSFSISMVYQESGMEGVFRELILYKLQIQDAWILYKLAEYYAFLGDKKKALSYLEECFESRIKSTVYMKYNPYFKNLKSEPRFQTLLKKMGLED